MYKIKYWHVLNVKKKCTIILSDMYNYINKRRFIEINSKFHQNTVVPSKLSITKKLKIEKG